MNASDCRDCSIKHNVLGFFDIDPGDFELIEHACKHTNAIEVPDHEQMGCGRLLCDV